jgi:hypothetical protein
MGLQTKIKPKAYKYEIECEAFREKENEYGSIQRWDLWTEGDNLSELIENARLWSNGRNVEADGDDVEVYITKTFLEMQEKERK